MGKIDVKQLCSFEKWEDTIQMYSKSSWRAIKAREDATDNYSNEYSNKYAMI